MSVESNNNMSTLKRDQIVESNFAEDDSDKKADLKAKLFRTGVLFASFLAFVRKLLRSTK